MNSHPTALVVFAWIGVYATVLAVLCAAALATDHLISARRRKSH